MRVPHPSGDPEWGHKEKVESKAVAAAWIRKGRAMGAELIMPRSSRNSPVNVDLNSEGHLPKGIQIKEHTANKHQWIH